MRLFLSIALTESLRERIVKSREEMMRTSFTREQLQRMRWIHETEYHITQYFIGEVSSERLEDLKSVVQRAVASTRPFMLVSYCFEFKPRNNPRLLWLRFQSNDAFARLQLELHNALVDANLSNNDVNEEPIPHVTLIRLKQVKPISNALPEFEPQTIDVTQIELMQSFMKPTGAKYQVLKRFDLMK